MFRELTISELQVIWDTSEVTVRKKVKQNIKEKVFQTGTKKVRGKNVTTYIISEDKLLEIKKEIAENKNLYSGHAVVQNISENNNEILGEVFTEHYDEHLEHNNIQGLRPVSVIEIMQAWKQDLDNTSKTHYEMLREKDKQIYLLEDSEKKKEEGYLRQLAEMKTENERLKKDLENVNKENADLKDRLNKKRFFGLKF